MSRRRAAPQVLARRGELSVERDPRRPSGRLLRDAGMEASYVDLADPRHLEFAYLRWIREVLVLARARRVLHIGGGGCALPRALLTRDPESRHEVCEVSADVLALAREHLGLRRSPGLRVRERDGRAFLADQRDRAYDAAVIDAFVGARVPPSLVTVEACGELARIAPLALLNVVDGRGGQEVARVGAALSIEYPSVLAIGGRDDNTLLLATVARLELDRLAARLAADPEPARLTPPDELAARLLAASPSHD
jgi:hypothetical protein